MMKISMDLKSLTPYETEGLINIFSLILSYVREQRKYVKNIEDIAKELTREGITIPFSSLIEVTGIEDEDKIVELIRKTLDVEIKIFKENGILSTGLITEYLILSSYGVNIELTPTIAKFLTRLLHN